MEWAEWMKWLIPIISGIFGAGGVWALLAARAAAKATQRAAEIAAEPATAKAVTADWSQLMGYWQSEIAALRKDAATTEVRLRFLEEQREDDIAHIEALEQHIWSRLPPPPPVRRRRPFKPEDS